MTTLNGKVALVTGASCGIGAAVARRLADEGVKLGLTSRRGDDLGIAGAVAPGDVRDAGQLEKIVSATVDTFGRLDILVPNAGVGAYGPFLDLAPDFLEEMIDVNVKGTLCAVRAALPHLLESDEADIVTLASEAGRRGFRSKRSIALRSSRKSASPEHSTTSWRSTACGSRTSAGRGRTDFALEEG
jgi:NADP-dependent 3-hydroxy acid dehydrogenase YdfG